ncbi:MAG: plasmid mobilization relaxosome protein MobC [Sphaerochaetaceae bacterium]|nr:plasmid mobilization relaxosome protein MobC [Sphaerochaetaceae bacterium]
MARKRRYDVRIRMNKEEKETFQKKLEEAGNLTMESYGLDALLNCKVTSQDEIDNLVEINKQFSKMNQNLSLIGNNINQIARKVNSENAVTQDELENLSKEISKYKESEVQELWQSIRLYLAEIKQHHH